MGRKNQAQKLRQALKVRQEAEEKEIADIVDKLLRICTVPQQSNILNMLEHQKEISSVTDKIKSLELNKDSTHSAGTRTTAATIDNFTKWVDDNGAQLKGCSITEFDGFELGLKVTTHIPQSSLVIAVPRKLMLSVETAKKTALNDLIEKDQILKNMSNVTLAIFLLFEKFKENSFWKPYIDILPKNYTTVMYFDVEELEELKGSPTLEIALRQIKSIGRQYAYFHKLFHGSVDSVSRLMRNRFTYSEYW